MRGHQVVLPVLLQSFHKLIRNRRRNIKVSYSLSIILTMNKLQNVRVIHSQNSHICPSPFSSLLNLVGSLIINPHERHRTASYSHIISHPGAGWSQSTKREPSPPTALVN